MAKNKYYAGPRSDHFDGALFFNPTGTVPRGLRDFLKWQFVEPSAKWPKSFPSLHVIRQLPPLTGDTVRVTFIGHASFLVEGGGKAILIDPVWSERASPFHFAGPRRCNAPGVPFDALPKIDAVLVTHNHYDHMDVPTLKRLWQRDRPLFVTPLGNDALLRQGIGAIDVTALDWNTGTMLGEGGGNAIFIDAVPTQHWSARGTGDRMHALWASFVLRVGSRVIYAVGDSGLGDGWIFRDVGRRYPGIDLALLPIGAYEPRWFMRNQHMNPDDAVQAFEMCGARRALGHHWGTFQLTNEAIEAPRAALEVALAARGIAAGRFVAGQPGLMCAV